MGESSGPASYSFFDASAEPGVAYRYHVEAVTLEGLGYDVYPSEANFVFFGGLDDQSVLWQALLDASVLVRDVGVHGHLRVTAGTPDETDAFVEAITAIAKETAA